MTPPFKDWPVTARWITGILLGGHALIFVSGKVYGGDSQRLIAVEKLAEETHAKLNHDHDTLIKTSKDVEAVLRQQTAMSALLDDVRMALLRERTPPPK